ncbi:MAG: biotin--[acetyl-CoA-carboxylase] ligase [Bdellovibrionales bacterium]
MDIFEITKTWAQKTDLKQEFFHEIESTNDYIKQNLKNFEVPGFVVCSLQTKGRGRGNNSWISPSHGSALMASWVLPLETTPQPISSFIFAKNVYCSLLGSHPEEDWNLKLPNDIFLGNKKFGGILLEAVSTGSKNYLIFGIGCNFLSTPPDLPMAATIGKGFSKSKYINFLDLLNQSIEDSKEYFSKQTLSIELRSKLIEACNRGSNNIDRIVSITEMGTVSFENSPSIHWSEL